MMSVMDNTFPASVRTTLGCACCSFLAAFTLLLTAPALEAAERIELDNGDVYEGDVVEGTRTGSGIYIWADGNRYEGEFDANTMHGKGTYTWIDGRSYTGDFVRDRRHGEGRFVWANLDVYEGNFVDGQRTGKGKIVWRGEAEYTGEFLNDELHGEGSYRWQDGRQYIGQYDRGQQAGRGVFIWPNGNRYAGQFTADQRHGDGVFYWRDGTVYRGQFSNNKMHGWGIKRQPDGQQELQHWIEGTLDLNQIISAQPNCALIHLERPWMFDSPECVNGLAHGSGVAASLDGQLIIPEARFVLGRLVQGSVLTLPLEQEGLPQPAAAGAAADSG